MSTATIVSLMDDDYAGPFSIGFDFDFYGETKTDFYLASNGYIGLGDATSYESNRNQCPPRQTYPYEIVMGYWDDLDPEYSGRVSYFQGGTAPYRFLAIEWDSVPHWNSSNDNVTFQIILHETSNWIEMHYLEVSSERGESGTTGIKNADGLDSLTVGCDSIFLMDDYSVWIGLAGPFGLAAEQAGESVALQWSDDNALADGTVIERAELQVGPWAIIGQTGNGVLHYEDTSPDECTQYHYRVYPHFGNVQFGPYTDLTQIETPPFIPDNVLANAVSSVQVQVTWDDESGCEAGYAVERKSDFESDWADITGILQSDIQAFNDNDVLPGIQYDYRVITLGVSFDSDFSDTVSVVPGLEAPVELRASVFTEAKIDLAWSDESPGEIGFSIERKSGIGDFEEVANVGKDVTSYRDAVTGNVLDYTYRVRAFALYAFSDYSNEASAAEPDDDDDDDYSDDDDDDVVDDDDDDSVPLADDDDDEAGCCG